MAAYISTPACTCEKPVRRPVGARVDARDGDDAAAHARLHLWNRALDRGEEGRDRDSEGLVDVMRLDGEQRLERSRRSVRE